MKILFVLNDKYDNPLIDYLMSVGDSVFVYSSDIQENTYDELDIIYLLSSSKESHSVLKEALKHHIPLITDYSESGTKNEKKRLYKTFYKYINAIRYNTIKEKNEFEEVIERRTNGHVISGNVADVNYLKKIRSMIIQYSSEENHTDKKKYYYSDEVNDDFAMAKIKVNKHDPHFKYVHTNLVWRFIATIIYRCIGIPVAFLINKIGFGQRIKNKRILKKNKHKGYFVYVNHTHGLLDAFTPSQLSFKRAYIIVSRETVSIPGIKGLVSMFGAIPVYNSFDEVSDFNNCIKTRIQQGNCIAIYPEAHIWPRYTKIRPFKKDSFRYPVDLKAPIYVLTNTWQKRRFTKSLKVVSYLSGPILPDENLPRKEAIEELRNRVLYEMTRVTSSVKQIDKYQYIKVKKD